MKATALHAIDGALPNGFTHCPLPSSPSAGEITTDVSAQRGADTTDFENEQDPLTVYWDSTEIEALLEEGRALPENIIFLMNENFNIQNGSVGDRDPTLSTACEKNGVPPPPYETSLPRKVEARRRCVTKLYHTLASRIDQCQAIHRGRFQSSACRIERRGVPIDYPRVQKMKKRWSEIRRGLIRELDADTKVFEQGVLKQYRLEQLAQRLRIEWPRSNSGSLKTDKDTLKSLAFHYRELESLAHLVKLLSQIKNFSLPVCDDHRHRYASGSFMARTGRSQPRSCIWNMPSYFRGLIKPPPGKSLSYLDYSQQELGIAAALSGDINMQEAYKSGDAYIQFAIQAGSVPNNATKESHPRERMLYKTVALGVLYGMGARGFSLRLGIPLSAAENLIREHHRVYPIFWAWSDDMLLNAQISRRISSCYGWGLNVSAETKETTLKNFPMQANGAEILRLAVIKATEAGVPIISMVHDALVLETATEEADHFSHMAKVAMIGAGATVLGGFRLKVDVDITTYPNSLLPQKGAAMWNRINDIITEIERKEEEKNDHN